MQPRQPAYSLIFAFLVMTVIMIVATTTIENTKEKLVYFNEMEGSTEAKLAAQSAAELAVLEMKDANAGYSIALVENSFEVDDDGDGNPETWGDYSVYSTAQENSNESGTYFTPIPGTGTAAREDDCTVTDSDHDGDFDNDEDVDHPCNWNKLMYGDTVTIPLYTDDGLGNILVPSDLGLNEWYLRIRTPCEDGSTDSISCTRYTMDENGELPEGDNVIFWQLVGEEEILGVFESVSLVPNDFKDEDFFSPGEYTRSTSSNTEIYEALINDHQDSGDYVVLEASSSSPYTEILNTCNDTDLTSLSLQLDIVVPLEDTGGHSIPYLEWQFMTDSVTPFADTKAVIRGEGYHQGSKGIFYFPYVVTRSTTGESTVVYTLSN